MTLMEAQMIEGAGDLSGMKWRSQVNSSTLPEARSLVLLVASADRPQQPGDDCHYYYFPHEYMVAALGWEEAVWMDEHLAAGACETDLATGERVEWDDLQ